MKKIIITLTILVILFSGCLQIPEDKITVIDQEFQVYKVWRGYAYGFFYLVDYVDNGEIKQIRLPYIGNQQEITITVFMGNKTYLVKNYYGYKRGQIIEHWILYLNSSQKIDGISSEYSEGKSTKQSQIMEIK